MCITQLKQAREKSNTSHFHSEDMLHCLPQFPSFRESTVIVWFLCSTNFLKEPCYWIMSRPLIQMLQSIGFFCIQKLFLRGWISAQVTCCGHQIWTLQIWNMRDFQSGGGIFSTVVTWKLKKQTKKKHSLCDSVEFLFFIIMILYYIIIYWVWTSHLCSCSASNWDQRA